MPNTWWRANKSQISQHLKSYQQESTLHPPPPPSPLCIPPPVHFAPPPPPPPHKWSDLSISSHYLHPHLTPTPLPPRQSSTPNKKGMTSSQFLPMCMHNLKVLIYVHSLIFTLAKNFLRWTYFGPTRFIHPWTTLMHAILRVNAIVDWLT